MYESNKQLLVDVGNTRIKYLANPADANRICSVSTFNELSLDGMEEVRVAAVSRHGELERWIDGCAVPVRLAKVIQGHHGLSVSYSDVTRLGVDRWLAMLSLWVERKTSFCVVDLGTAITVDYVDANGQHRGGYILPGYQLMKQALGLHTQQVGFGGESDALLPGGNTQDCVDHGINRIVADFLRGISRTNESEYEVILTGGDAKKAALTLDDSKVETDEALVIRGLRYCFE